MKRFNSFFKILFIIVFTFIIQILIANNLKIFGVNPNIILVTITIISMWSDIKVSIFSAAVLGIMSDLVFNYNFGRATISYISVALLISYISKKYRKDSKTAIMYITITSTIVYSSFQLIHFIIQNQVFVNVFALLKQNIVEILLNISIAYVVYKVFEKHMKDKSLKNVFN